MLKTLNRVGNGMKFINMKNLELEKFGLVEMNQNEMQETAGGKSLWSCYISAFSDLTDSGAGCVAVAVMPGPCLLAIGIGGTINYFRHNK